MKNLKNILKENKEFILANRAYLVESAVGSASAYIRIETNSIEKLNPIIQKPISVFGTS